MQGHVVAAEQQTMIVQQGGTGDCHILCATQCPVVVQRTCREFEVGRRGQPSIVVQLTINVDVGIATASNFGAIAQIQLTRMQVEPPLTGDSSITAISAREVDI